MAPSTFFAWKKSGMGDQEIIAYAGLRKALLRLFELFSSGGPKGLFYRYC